MGGKKEKKKRQTNRKHVVDPLLNYKFERRQPPAFTSDSIEIWHAWYKISQSKSRSPINFQWSNSGFIATQNHTGRIPACLNGNSSDTHGNMKLPPESIEHRSEMHKNNNGWIFTLTTDLLHSGATRHSGQVARTFFTKKNKNLKINIYIIIFFGGGLACFACYFGINTCHISVYKQCKNIDNLVNKATYVHCFLD